MRTSILVFLVLGLVAIVLCGPPKKGQPNEREIGKTFNKIKDNLQKQIDGANAAGDTKKVEDLQKRMESMLQNEDKVKQVTDRFQEKEKDKKQAMDDRRAKMPFPKKRGPPKRDEL